MKKKIICILVMTLLIAIVVLPVEGTRTVDIDKNTDMNPIEEVSLNNGYVIDQYQLDGGSWAISKPIDKHAQSFKPTMTPLVKVDLYIKKQSELIESLEVSIHKELDENDLTHITVSSEEVPIGSSWIEFDFPDIEVELEQTYYIMYSNNQATFDSCCWQYASKDPYVRGALWFFNSYTETWSLYNEDDHTFKTYTFGENLPPEKPEKPSGPSSGNQGERYKYSTSTVDPDGEQVYYLFDWGDGTDSGWIGPRDNGETVEQYNVWNIGIYQIKVKAKDLCDLESEWSDPLVVTMPRNRAINTPFMQFLEQYPILYQLLLRFLQL